MRIGYHLVLVWGSIDLFFLWVVEIGLILDAGRSLAFSTSIEIDLVFVWVVEINLISVWGMELDLISL